MLLMEQHFGALRSKFIKRDVHLLLCIQTEEILLKVDRWACCRVETMISFGASSEVVNILYFTFLCNQKMK